MSALANIDNLKRYLNKDDSDEDALLDALLNGISVRMQSAIGHPIVVTSHTQEPHLSVGYSTLVLNFSPVKEISEIDEDDTILTTAEWRLEGEQTIVRLSSSGRPQSWAGQVLITYKSGFQEIPEDLALAAVTQAAFEYKQTGVDQNRLGLTNRSPESGDGVGYEPLQFLPGVIEAMKPYQGLL